MIPSTLYVTASFMVKSEGLAEMLNLLAELTLRTRQEPGCLDYGYFQSLENPLQLTSFEVWQSVESEALHWQTGHLADALSRAAGLLQDTPRITKYRRVC